MNNRWLIPTALAAVIALAFSPAIFAEVSTLDDAFLFAGLEKLPGMGWQRIFFRAGSSGLYYRPFLDITYHLDKVLWGLNPVIMHLENVLLHVLNCLLLFCLTKRFIPQERTELNGLPLVAALLFGLNPVVAESVNWISGRTDLLATSFILSAVYVLVLYRQTHNVFHLVGASLLFLGGMLSKEVSVALLPGLLCLLFASRQEVASLTFKRTGRKASYLWIGGWVGAAFAGFVLLRTFGYNNNSSSIGLTLQVIMDDLYYSLFVCLRALGFYIKKIYWPFPLNLAILEVDPLYELFGIVVVCFCLYLLWKRTPLGALFLTGIFLVVPAFLLAFNQLAWTPYAERYVYAPSAFILSATVLYLGRFVKIKKPLTACIMALFLLCWGGASFARSQVWSTNLTLWKDTITKSPNCATAWSDYGLALQKDGRFDEAVKSFRKASSLNNFRYDDSYDLNLANAYIEMGRIDDAMLIYPVIYEKSRGRSRRGLQDWQELLSNQIRRTKDPARKKSLEVELARVSSLPVHSEK